MNEADLINALTKQFENSLSEKGFANWIALPEENRKQFIFAVFVAATPEAKRALSR